MRSDYFYPIVFIEHYTVPQCADVNIDCYFFSKSRSHLMEYKREYSIPIHPLLNVTLAVKAALITLVHENVIEDTKTNVGNLWMVSRTKTYQTHSRKGTS